MIEEIRVENLGVVEHATIRPAPTLTAITGETGTGKTMVLTSLGLLLGSRAEAALVRTGSERAVVEGSVLLDPDGPHAGRAREAGADLDGDCLLVARTLPAAGRSRAHLGGRAVPGATLGDVLGPLVTVHGQSDQLRLRSAEHQRAALDAAGGTAHRAALDAYGAAWERLRAARAAARTWREQAAARRYEIAELTALVERADALEPSAGEDHALRAEALRLGNVEELRAAAADAHGALVGDPDATGASGPGAAAALVESARRALDRAGTLDPQLRDLAGRLAEAGYLLADAGTDLASYLAGLEGDPGRLAHVHGRIADLTELSRGFEDLDAYLEHLAGARERLGALTGPAADGAALQAELDAAAQEVRDAGEAVTTGRRAAAERLMGAVDAELAGLAMGGAHLRVELTQRDRPGPHGMEDVAFLLLPHPGAPARPLGQGASGGELSRVMLALEVVLAGGPDAGADGPARRTTMVFDEIDAGIGGRAAVEVGRRLARLARRTQVIVVTHLPQVAAYADRHLVVTKHVDQGRTTTRVTGVEGDDRVAELARMLSGHDDSSAALRHAAELLDGARVPD